MVQIPEYTRRDTFEAVGRPSTNIQLPDALASSKGKNIFGLSINDLKTVAKGAEEVSKEMVDMKRSYDNAKANEYIADYMRGADAQIQKYQSERKGRLSDGLIEDFEKWSENSFNTATNINQETQTALLENKEQRDIARKKMDDINLNYFRSISAFQAKEREAYQQNQATAFIDSQLNQVVSQNDPISIQNSFLSIYKEAKNNLYKGQSDEFVSFKLKPLKSNALAQNVVNTSITNPDEAVFKMTNPVFKDNMDPKDYSEVKETVLKSVKSFYSDKISDIIQYGVTDDFGLNNLLTSPFFKGMDVEAFKSEIQTEAEKKYKEKAEKERNNSIDAQNQIITNAYGREFTTDEIQVMLSTYGGAESLDTINMIRQNEANEIFNLEQGELPIEATHENALNYVAINNRIKSGQYRTIGEMQEDLFDLPPYMQKEILGSFVDELKFKKDAEMLKKNNGIDIEKELKSRFSDLTELNADKNKNAFYNFRNGVINSIISEEKTGKKIDIDLIKKASSEYVSSIYNSKDDANVIRKIEFDLASSMNETKGMTLIEIKTKVHELLNSTDLDDVLLKKQQENIEDLIVNGAVEEATYMLNYYREQYMRRGKQKQRYINEDLSIRKLLEPNYNPFEA